MYSGRWSDVDQVALLRKVRGGKHGGTWSGKRCRNTTKQKNKHVSIVFTEILNVELAVHTQRRWYCTSLSASYLPPPSPSGNQHYGHTSCHRLEGFHLFSVAGANELKQSRALSTPFFSLMLPANNLSGWLRMQTSSQCVFQTLRTP